MSDFLAIQAQTGWGRTLRSFAAWCAPAPGWRCLDVGSGPGLLPAFFQAQGCLAVGVDQAQDSFSQGSLHPALALARAQKLPFQTGWFHLVTASNLLFLLAHPQPALAEMARVTRTGGWVAVLNPSEGMSVGAARTLADQHGLEGLARASLLDWAQRAEAHWRWDAAALAALFETAGLVLLRSELRVGPGLARFAAGKRS